MKRTMLKSKIHMATVTDANINYEGSISIDQKLCSAADFIEFEKVDIYNCTNGSRFSTYVIFGKPGEVCLNGAAARLTQIGDRIIIASYAKMDDSQCKTHKPLIVFVDESNNITPLSTVRA